MSRGRARRGRAPTRAGGPTGRRRGRRGDLARTRRCPPRWGRRLPSSDSNAGRRDFLRCGAPDSTSRCVCRDMSRLAVLRGVLGAVAALALAVPAAYATQTGPDYVSSDNVQYVTSDRLPGDGVGARVVGKYLYVTTTTGLTIYDIQSNPAAPKKIGFETMDVEFENEEV